MKKLFLLGILLFSFASFAQQGGVTPEQLCGSFTIYACDQNGNLIKRIPVYEVWVCGFSDKERENKLKETQRLYCERNGLLLPLGVSIRFKYDGILHVATSKDFTIVKSLE